MANNTVAFYTVYIILSLLLSIRRKLTTCLVVKDFLNISLAMGRNLAAVFPFRVC